MKVSRESHRSRLGKRLVFDQLEPRLLLSTTASDTLAGSLAGVLASTDTTLSSSSLTADASAGLSNALSNPARQMENLDRGVVAINQGSGKVHIGWRLLGTDPSTITFNLYRSTGGGAAVKLNSTPIITTTDYVDNGVNTALSNAYFVRPVIGGVEQAASESFMLGSNAPAQQYLGVPLQIPPSE